MKKHPVKNYVVYDPATGEIIQSGTCQEDHYPTGENVLEAAGAFATHYVLDGELVAYTQDQMHAKALRRNLRSVWDNAAMAWVDIRPLDEKKQAAIDLVKSEIAAYEATSQGRAIREYILAANQEARDDAALHLRSIDARIGAKRAKMVALENAKNDAELSALTRPE